MLLGVTCRRPAGRAPPFRKYSCSSMSGFCEQQLRGGFHVSAREPIALRSRPASCSKTRSRAADGVGIALDDEVVPAGLERDVRARIPGCGGFRRRGRTASRCPHRAGPSGGSQTQALNDSESSTRLVRACDGYRSAGPDAVVAWIASRAGRRRAPRWRRRAARRRSRVSTRSENTQRVQSCGTRS